MKWGPLAVIPVLAIYISLVSSRSAGFSHQRAVSNPLSAFMLVVHARIGRARPNFGAAYSARLRKILEVTEAQRSPLRLGVTNDPDRFTQ